MQSKNIVYKMYTVPLSLKKSTYACITISSVYIFACHSSEILTRKLDGYFGNDYLITFDKDGVPKSQSRLHHDLIAFKDQEGSKNTFHTDLASTGKFITATDICTLMLYGSIMHWKQHDVVGPHNRASWDCFKQNIRIEALKDKRLTR